MTKTATSLGAWVESAARFGWACSTFGADQLLRTLDRRTRAEGADGRAVLDRASELLGSCCGPTMRSAFDAGERLQTRAIGLLFGESDCECGGEK